MCASRTAELHWLPDCSQVQLKVLVLTFKALHVIGWLIWKIISPQLYQPSPLDLAEKKCVDTIYHRAIVYLSTHIQCVFSVVINTLWNICLIWSEVSSIPFNALEDLCHPAWMSQGTGTGNLFRCFCIELDVLSLSLLGICIYFLIFITSIFTF